MVAAPLVSGFGAVSLPGRCARAVRESRALAIRYGTDGVMQPLRRVVPLGVVRGWNGALYLMAAQLSGPSRSRTLDTVKTFRLDRIRSARALGRAAWTGAPAQPPGFVCEVVCQRADQPLLEPFHLRSRRRKSQDARAMRAPLPTFRR